jgi:hypothetical protein
MHVNVPKVINYHILNLIVFPLELIHSNVWGPAIASSSSFKYYMSFIDDYSRLSLETQV